MPTGDRLGAWRGQLDSYGAFATDLGYSVQLTQEARVVAEQANLIVCTTPSRAPLLMSEWVQPGTHITAVGADTPGKQELDPALVARARHLKVDSVAQCSQYGEVSHALKSGLIEASQLVELGALLAEGRQGRQSEQAITLADLTGVAVQDARIAQSVLDDPRLAR